LFEIIHLTLLCVGCSGLLVRHSGTLRRTTSEARYRERGQMQSGTIVINS